MSSPLVDAAKALYDHFHAAVDAMPLPSWAKPQEDKPQQADPGMVQDANKSFQDAAAKKLTPDAAQKIRMKASGK